jgi:hypothetical protein
VLGLLHDRRSLPILLSDRLHRVRDPHALAIGELRSRRFVAIIANRRWW